MCIGSPNRLQVSMSLLDDLNSYFDNYHDCDFVIAGDFNVNLDGSDVVALCVQNRGLRVYPYPRVYPTRPVTRGSGRVVIVTGRVG